MTAISPNSLRAYAGVVENVSPDTLRRSLTSAADEIEALRAVVRHCWPQVDGHWLRRCASAEQAAALDRALGSGSSREVDNDPSLGQPGH